MAAHDLTARMVTELMVRDLQRSVDLYTGLGFAVERRSGSFAVLSWGGRPAPLPRRGAGPSHHAGDAREGADHGTGRCRHG